MMRRTNFTLIEMVVVVALLLVIAASVGFGFFHALEKERFKGAVCQVKSALSIAEGFTEMGEDVRCYFSVTPQGFSIEIVPERGLLPATKVLLNTKRKIDGVDTITYIEEGDELIGGEIELKYISRAYPLGVLWLRKKGWEEALPLNKERKEKGEEPYPYAMEAT